jgi:hypothetical protein
MVVVTVAASATMAEPKKSTRWARLKGQIDHDPNDMSRRRIDTHFHVKVGRGSWVLEFRSLYKITCKSHLLLLSPHPALAEPNKPMVRAAGAARIEQPGNSSQSPQTHVRACGAQYPR